MATTILLRRDTAANWSGVNPVLGSGEPGFEIDTYRLKIGKNGLPWNSLPYIAGTSGVHWSGVTNKPAVISGISNVTGVISGQILYATGINMFVPVSLSGYSGVNINYSPGTNSIIFSVTELVEVSGTGSVSISSGITKINTPQVILGTGTQVQISGSTVKINGDLQVSGTSTFIPSINIYSPGGPGPQCSGVNSDLGSPTINLLTYDSNKKVALRNLDGLFEIVGYGSGVAEYGFPFPGDCVAQEEISTFYINPKTGYISMVSGLVSVYPDGSITANTVYANSGIFGYINFSGSNAVTGVIAGTGIGVYQSGSSYIISNSGIIKLIASSGINISGTSGNYTISSALIAGTGIDLSENSGTYTIKNSGVIKIVAGSGIGISAISGSGGNFIISNSGVISIIAGDGISVSSISGDYTISNTGVNSIVAVNPGINITTNNSGIYYIEQKILGGTGIVLGSGVGSDLHIHSNLYGGSGIRVSGSSGIYSLSLSGIPVYSITSGSYIQVINSGGYFTISATGLQPSGDYSFIGHTHTSSGIIDFNSAVSGLLTVKNILQGSGISISGASGNYTISVSGLNSSYISDFNEAVDDRIGSGLFVAGTGINLSYNDTLNTFTISTTGVSLSGHTHTASNITDFNSAVSGLLTGYSVSGHTHTASNITDFNSAVSGLLPVKDVLAGTGISISSSSGIYTITSTGAGVNADSATQSASVVTTVFNKTASTIPKMSAVYINGGQGDQPTIQLAIATGDSTSAATYGLTYESISSMSAGKVIVFGALVGVNTDQFNPTAPTGDINGSILYLSPTTSGTLTTIKPSAPNHIVAIGTVVRTHQNAGVIEVRVQNGFELDELHNVAISGVTNGQFLQYNSTSGLWIPSSSGNFSTLQVNGTGVSVSGHTHTSSDITNFNSSVSGLLPSISGSTNINVSSSNNTYTISATGLQTSLTNPITGTGTTNYISKWTSSSGLNNSNIYDNGTNVGVGTTTPSGQLHVIGTGIFSNRVGINTNSPATQLDIAAGTNTDGLRIKHQSNNYNLLQFVKSDNSNILRQSYDGSDTLYTYYNLPNNYHMLGTSGNILLYGGGAGNYNGLWLINGVPLIINNTNGTYATASASIWDGGYNYATTGTQLTSVTPLALTTYSWDGSNGYTIRTDAYLRMSQLSAANNSAKLSLVRSSDNKEILTVNFSGNGNIGIGTSTPSGQLHVIGTGIISSSLGIGTNSPSYPLHINGSGYLSSGLVLGSSTTSGFIRGLSDTTNIPGIIFDCTTSRVNQLDYIFDFRKNDSRLIGIDAGGNLLAPNGTFLAQSTTPSAGTSAFVGHGMRRFLSTNGFDFAWGEGITSTSEPGIDLFPIGGTHITSGILFRLSKNSTKTSVAMLVDGNGRVGIGTSPSYALHVIGTGNFSQNLLVGGTAVSLNGHTHNPSDITNLIANQGDNRLLTSTGSSNNINAESNLNFDGTNLVITSGTAQRVIQGSTVSFSKADYAGTGVYDPIISGVLHIARDNVNGIFNVVSESYYDTINYISPSGTEWNWDGWSNLHNFKTRTYTTFYYALNQAIGNNVVGAELIMRHIPTQRYWKIKFSSWTQGGNGGGFAYTRNELYLSDLIDKTNPTYTNGTVLIGSGTSLVPNTLSAGSNISITNGSGTISIAATGLQSLLTNPITGTGTTNYISKFSSTSGLANSQIFDNGTGVGIGTASPSGKLQVIGNVNISGILTATSGSITTLNTVPTYLSPSALGSSQGDWNPGAGDIIRLSASTSGVNISGIVLGNEYTRVLINVGTTHNITLKHQATTATSGNRIITSTGGDHIIPPTGTVTILYDVVDSRWRIL